MDNALGQFRMALAQRGYRMTEARRVVVNALIAAGGHVSADELVELVRNSGSEVGRMTVYRTLDLLSELGLVRPVYQGTGAAHFILLQDGHHHHLICTRCNAVVEVESCLFSDIESRLLRDSEFEIQGHLLEIFGVCPKCQKESFQEGRQCS